ncbi:MAG: hypothetical protein D6689_19025 [Deltaproteobacteria bacterium]|nr:MAG: hypothetical protein D6689_19025 [Deltaproteobacteria bacterium]
MKCEAMAWAAVVVVAACGGDDGDHHGGADGAVDCAQETRADAFAPGMVKMGDNGTAVRLVEADPAPPARFDNAWVLAVEDASGAPRDDAQVAVTPWMPDHGHGTPIEAVVTPRGSDGLYDVAPINLWMPGLWEIRIDATVDGVDDRVVFAFCIDE